MDVTNEAPMDYTTVLEDLEAQLRAGQAQYEAWEQERNELLTAIESIRKLLRRQGSKQQMALPLPGGHEHAPTAAGFGPHSFRGLTYREATKKVLGMVGQPLSAPDVTNILFKAGYAKDRRKIKSNIDGIFKRLRDEGAIERVDDSTFYRLAEANGGHPSLLSS